MSSLPRGRHGLSREFIAEHQRARLFAATAVVLDRDGYDATTVSVIVREAGVSKSDFYALFSSKDDCFGAAYDDAVEELRVAVLAAGANEGEWAGRICTGLASALTVLAAEPARANLLLVEGLRAGPDICGRFQRAVDGFVLCLRDGAPGPLRPAGATDEAVVGGIASVLARRVLAGEAAGLGRLFPELAEFALAPYLGVAEARRIISSR